MTFRKKLSRLALIGVAAGVQDDVSKEAGRMKILVAYATRHGATKGIAERIAQHAHEVTGWTRPRSRSRRCATREGTTRS